MIGKIYKIYCKTLSDSYTVAKILFPHLKLNTIFREELQMDISQDLNTDDYSFVDGQSSIQRNSYDCGVFSLMNIEKYVIGRPLNQPIVQPLMKLFRLRILGKLYQQSVQLGLSH